MNASARRREAAWRDAETLDIADVGRARIYSLIASLLLAPPDEALLQSLRSAHASDDDASASLEDLAPFEQAWQRLARAARAIDAACAADEYARLFLAVGTPQVDPSASLYLSGFRMDAPLAALRAELRSLGLSRSGGVAETEDHLGALCETMRLLIVGTDGFAPRPLDCQRAFFDAWIAPWYRACTHDLHDAGAAVFYRSVADLSDAFFELESEAFELRPPDPGGA